MDRRSRSFHSWGKRRSIAGSAADIAQTRCASDWKRLSAGAGTKGPRLHDWCYLELADLDAEEFNSAKNEFGLDHNESRSWHGWHRHVSLVMLAFAMMAVIRHRANPTLPKKMQRRLSLKKKAHHPRDS